MNDTHESGCCCSFGRTTTLLLLGERDFSQDPGPLFSPPTVRHIESVLTGRTSRHARSVKARYAQACETAPRHLMALCAMSPAHTADECLVLVDDASREAWRRGHDLLYPALPAGSRS